MSDLTDFRISFYFEPRADQPHAPDGPGFYLAAMRRSISDHESMNYEIVPRVRIPNDEMINISKVLDRFVDGKPLNWSPQFKRDDVSLEAAVLDAIQGGKAILAEEVAKAEAAASQLERLRKIQEEFDA